MKLNDTCLQQIISVSDFVLQRELKNNPLFILL